MSIFNSSFEPTIQQELNARQNNILNRTNILSLIQPTAWIRATSGINSNNSNKLAKQNVLFSILGGNKNPQGDIMKGYTTSNRHGIRPLPGITNLDCQSFTSNGSLRKVTIKFNCWDNQQLETMEQLYLRPGYLMCIEWGWSHELGTGKKLNFPNFGEKFLDSNSEFKNKTLLELYQIANDEVKSVNGNYDICIGRVQNFNWQLRKDNGYDCETTIVTYGEILDSFKINNIDNDNKISVEGLKIPYPNSVLSSLLDTVGIAKYSEGKLCGILNDLKEYSTNIANSNFSNKATGYLTQAFTLNFNLPKINEVNGINVDMFASSFNNDIINNNNNNSLNLSHYITFKSFCDILNYYILNDSLVKITTDNLYCQAHPFQLSCNPNICLIRPTGWIDSINLNQNNQELEKIEPGLPAIPNMKINIQNLLNDDSEIRFKAYASLVDYELGLGNSIEQANSNIQIYLENYIDVFKKLESNSDNTLTLYFKNSNKKFKTKLKENNQTLNLYNILFNYNDIEELKKTYGEHANGINEGKFRYDIDLFIKIISKQKEVSSNGEDPFNTKFIYPYKNIKNLLDNTSYNKDSFDNIQAILKINNDISLSENTIKALKPSELTSIKETLNNRFKDLNEYFLEPQINNYRTGKISDIYLNIDFLYNLIKPGNTNFNDKNNKNEITFNSFIKNILTEVQNSIGSINAFEIYADPIDNIVRIIDKDYIKIENKETFKPFEFNVDTTKSVITNLSLKSLIFPEQSTIVAISTQAPSGKLSYANGNLIQYNTGLTNRFINIDSNFDQNNKNIDPITNNTNTNPFYLSISQIIYYTNLLKFYENSNNESTNINLTALNNSLRDLINYWDSKHEPEANKSMPLPITINLEFPGIAGIRIGNIFNIEGGAKPILPSSFNNMNFLVKSISNSLDNNIWTTKIEGYPFKNN